MPNVTIENEVDKYLKLPHILKYMGSKREILDFVHDSIEMIENHNGWVCDLFAGTGIVSGSLKNEFNIYANDIQAYSRVFSYTYLSDLRNTVQTPIEQIKNEAQILVDQFNNKYDKYKFSYDVTLEIDQLRKVEKAQQDLIKSEFDLGFHLFAKYYSGTYWSYEQCVWIDSLRAVAEKYAGMPEYYPILSALMYAMSYTSQSTGHYAEYRDMTEDNMTDIISYRIREIWPYFEKKYKELVTDITDSGNLFKVKTLDYNDCLRIIDKDTIVYADPPYQSMHYSRFYHVLETLVKYDYPKLEFKGRYRDDRHQSPFCKKTTVKKAFKNLFDGIKGIEGNLVLSYSDTGMISLDEITSIGKLILGNKYKLEVLEKGHLHSNMGRNDMKKQEVTEYSIIFKHK